METVKIAFVAFYSDGSNYFARGNDDSVWAFVRENDGWTMEDGAVIPDGATVLSADAVTLAALPASIEVEGEAAPPPAETVVPVAAPVQIEPPKIGWHKGKFQMVSCSIVVPCIYLRARRGGPVVRYTRTDKERELTPTGDGNNKETLTREMTREIAALEEYVKMCNIRTKLRARIVSSCAQTMIGLLVPKERLEALKEKHAEVRKEIALANAEATHYRLTDDVVIAEIITGVDSAASSVASTLREVLDRVMEAVKSGDSVSMRQAVLRLRGFDAIVNPEAGAAINAVIQEARSIAHVVKREVETKGRALDKVLEEINTSELDAARMALLGNDEDSADADVDVPQMSARVLEPDTGGDTGAEVAAAGV